MSEYEVETIEKDNCTIHIYPDDDPESPREWDNMGTMVCFHNRYNLGDEKHDFYDPDDLLDFLNENKGKIIYLPLYLYDHSGISMSTGREYPFNCPWDSGQVGIIYVTYETIRKEYRCKRVSKKLRQRVVEYLQGEVETYDQYLTGDVYYYNVTCNKCGESVDSCGGFYGSNWKENGILEQAYTVCKDCKEEERINQEIDTRLDSILEFV
jgi:hypothetical protein